MVNSSVGHMIIPHDSLLTRIYILLTSCNILNVIILMMNFVVSRTPPLPLRAELLGSKQWPSALRETKPSSTASLSMVLKTPCTTRREGITSRTATSRDPLISSSETASPTMRYRKSFGYGKVTLTPQIVFL